MSAKYTYKILDVGQPKPGAEAEAELNALGAEGWWLAGVTSTSNAGFDATRLWFIKTEPSEEKPKAKW